jgi:hypothetical protein
MPKGKNTKSTVPYVRHLLEDAYVQEQLRNAAARLHTAYSRVAREGAQATEDKKLYDNVRAAATSLRNATIALRRSPEPPPKHHGRNLVIIALGIGGTMLIARAAQKQRNSVSSTIDASTEGPAAAGDVQSQPQSAVGAS